MYVVPIKLQTVKHDLRNIFKVWIENQWRKASRGEKRRMKKDEEDSVSGADNDDWV